METDPSDVVAPAASATYVERRHSVLSGVSTARLCLIAAVGLSIITLGAVLVVLIAQIVAGIPLQTRGLFILIGITAPTITALLGGAGISVVNVLDGNQARLMRAIAAKEHAEGKIEGLKENPNTNIS
jgi:hypothetical protein